MKDGLYCNCSVSYIIKMINNSKIIRKEHDGELFVNYTNPEARIKVIELKATQFVLV